MAINLLSSDYEPTDEELEEIMAAAAREAEKRDRDAHRKLFEEIEKEMLKTNMDSVMLSRSLDGRASRLPRFGTFN